MNSWNSVDGRFDAVEKHLRDIADAAKWIKHVDVWGLVSRALDDVRDARRELASTPTAAQFDRAEASLGAIKDALDPVGPSSEAEACRSAYAALDEFRQARKLAGVTS
jgi:hypothetical protein